MRVHTKMTQTRLGGACGAQKLFPAGFFAGRFSFRAASHGTSAFCIAAIFGCAGVMCLVDPFQKDLRAYGFCLLVVAASGLTGFLLFGFLADSRNLDAAGGPDD